VNSPKRTHSRRRGPLLVAAMLIAMSALGIAAAQANSLKSNEVTLKAAFRSDAKVSIDVMLANFYKAYPDVKIDVTYADTTQLDAVLKTQIQAGNPPDLVTSAPGSSGTVPVGTYGAQGTLLDVSGRPWQKRLPKFIKDLSTVNGKLLALPMQINALFVIYNVDLFKSLNITPPTTWAGFLNVCTKIKDAGKVPIFHAGGAIILNNVLAGELAANYVFGPGPLWIQKRNQDKATFAGSKGWKTVMQRILDMKSAGCFSPGVAGVTSSAQITANMAAGNAFMTLSGGNTIGAATSANPKVNLSTFPMPAENGRKGTYVNVYPGIAFSAIATTTHKKEVLQFLDFMARPKQNSLFTKLTHTIAPYDYLKGNFPADFKPEAALIKQGHWRVSTHVTWPTPLEANTLGTQITGLFTGQKSPDDVLKAVDAVWGK
jgi:raffinose/stachyose/melibiose transport system substrate-binding protein